MENPLAHLATVHIHELEKYAIERYGECPKLPTAMFCADQVGDSEFHCVPLIPFVGPAKPSTNPFHRNFIVPKQKVRLVSDPEYGLFSIIHVSEEIGGPEFSLVTSVHSRIGFLMPNDRVVTEEFKVRERAHISTRLQSAICSSVWFSSLEPASA